MGLRKTRWDRELSSNAFSQVQVQIKVELLHKKAKKLCSIGTHEPLWMGLMQPIFVCMRRKTTPFDDKRLPSKLMNHHTKRSKQ